MDHTFQDQVGSPSIGELCCGVPMYKLKLLSGTGEKNLYRCVMCGKEKPVKTAPTVQGTVSIQLIRASTGELVEERFGSNIFTDVGRNYLASLISYNLLTQAPGTDEPAASKRRFDGVRYMMVGTGSQLESNAVTALTNPVTFNTAGDYLAQVVAPNELPGTGISAVFKRIYGVNEISMPSTILVSEIGLFPSGPSSAPLSTSVSTHAPIAYHVFDPVPVTTEFLFAARWEIKF